MVKFQPSFSFTVRTHNHYSICCNFLSLQKGGHFLSLLNCECVCVCGLNFQPFWFVISCYLCQFCIVCFLTSCACYLLSQFTLILFIGSWLHNQGQTMAVKKASETFSKTLIEDVHKWGCLKQTGVSLKYMMEFGAEPTDKNLLISAQFLHKELPIRIARRAIELESLPYGLSQKPAVLKVPLF